MSSLLYTIELSDREPDKLKKCLVKHPEVRFISLMAVDFGNNHTDERIPVSLVLNDLDAFLRNGIQTDGSSVHLPLIATINNAKVDLIPDLEALWVVDYNWQHLDEDGRPVGTLIIPAFLMHNGNAVCSRSVLKKAIGAFEDATKTLVNAHLSTFDLNEPVEKIILTSATELEFWVKTPNHHSDIEKLSTSQNLKEQYWKRTYGQVRTAMEKSLLLLDRYGFHPEMGHKEVGGAQSKLAGTNQYTHIMEQLEIDWQYDTALNTADKEILAKDMIRDIFESCGLNVTFDAKPIEGVAGSGEHHHIGIAALTRSGRYVNLMSPTDMQKHFMTAFGYGALMGILKHYEVINPFVSSTNDSLNRLKPGFEAPVCIVSSLGQAPDQPSRNRTVLIGLIRDMDNDKATRFELRSPNPNSNSYLLLAACYQAMLDGIKHTLTSGQTLDVLAEGFSKHYGNPHFYLEANRVYRSEKDVFEDYSEEERNRLFGTPPKTVYDNLEVFNQCDEKTKALLEGNVFTDAVIASYKAYMLEEWCIELSERIIPSCRRTIRRFKKLHGDEDFSDLDIVNWERIKTLKQKIMKDAVDKPSLFTEIQEALADENYKRASELQVTLSANMKILTDQYLSYRNNLMDL